MCETEMDPEKVLPFPIIRAAQRCVLEMSWALRCKDSLRQRGICWFIIAITENQIAVTAHVASRKQSINHGLAPEYSTPEHQI